MKETTPPHETRNLDSRRRQSAVTIDIVIAGILLTLAFTLTTAPVAAQEVVVAPPGSGIPGAVTDLEAAVRDAEPGTVIRLAPGAYELTPELYEETTCGNCEEEATPVTATVGMVVSGEGIRIEGSSAGQTTIRTRAGYGILFEDCRDCALVGITVTGGVRDPAPEATDAAIVVKRSVVAIEDCTIRDNIGDSTLVAEIVVGIIGIAAREGSEITVRRNRILRNSWDGIALFRNSRAVIEGNLVDGVDMARGSTIGGGRGVGIGATWNAYADIRGNLVRRYWKGIGAFVDAQVTVEENVVEHIAAWGITLWDAGYGRPSGFFLRNVIYDTGACGASIIRESEDPPFPGRFVQNALVETCQNPRYDSGEPYCFQLPIAEHSVPSMFSVAGNVLYATRRPGGGPGFEDLSSEAFRYRAHAIWGGQSVWEVLREADFWKKYGPRIQTPG